MILFTAEAILASSSSKFGKSLPAFDRDDFNSSTESTISTSLIHDIDSQGKSEQELILRGSPSCILSVCHLCWLAVSESWSTRRNIRDLRRVFRVRERLVYLREAFCHEKIQFFDIHGRFFFCLHSVVWFSETFTVSNSADFRSFLLNMCIDAPESSLVGEKKVALSVSSSFKMFLASFHASPRAHRSCLAASPGDLSSNFLA